MMRRTATALLLLSVTACAGREATPPAPVAVAAPAAPLSPAAVAAAMPASRTIAANVAALPALSRLAAALTTVETGRTLAGAGPYTLFAPTDDAFGRLAAGTVGDLMQPENRATLARLLSYHVVPGSLTLDDVRARIAAGGGIASATTLGGQTLTFRMEGAALAVVDAGGNVAYVEVADVRQANGLVHVVNGVLLPR